MPQIIIIAIAAGIVILFPILYFLFLAAFYHKVSQGRALIRTGQGGIRVEFGKGMIVIPVLHQVETLDMTMKNIEVNCIGKDSLIWKNNIQQDIKAIFHIRVSKDPLSIITAARSFGCKQTFDAQFLQNHFHPKFSDALRKKAKQFSTIDLNKDSDKFRDAVILYAGQELEGYLLDDCFIQLI